MKIAAANRRRETSGTIESLLRQGIKTFALSEPEERACGKCGLSFQATWATQWVCRTCVEEGQRLTAEELRQKRAEERKRRLAAMGLVGRLTEMTFERFDQRANLEAYAKATGFVAGWADPWHRGLALLGNPGTGKTHLACAIVHALAEQGVNGRYVHVPTLASDLKAAQDWGAMMRERVLPLREVDVLVLDDLGRERDSPSWPETRDSLIDYRWVQGAPIVITANLDLKDLEAHLGPAAISRFLDGATRVTTQPIDRRLNPIRVVATSESQRSPTKACVACDGAAWVVDTRIPVGGTERLIKCPACQGRGW